MRAGVQNSVTAAVVAASFTALPVLVRATELTFPDASEYG